MCVCVSISLASSMPKWIEKYTLFKASWSGLMSIVVDSNNQIPLVNSECLCEKSAFMFHVLLAFCFDDHKVE